jgi:hypothetical protein
MDHRKDSGTDFVHDERVYQDVESYDWDGDAEFKVRSRDGLNNCLNIELTVDCRMDYHLS